MPIMYEIYLVNYNFTTEKLIGKKVLAMKKIHITYNLNLLL